MSLQSWATVLMMVLVLGVMLAIIGIVSEAVAGINEAVLLERP